MKNATKFLNLIFSAFLAVSISFLISGCDEKVEIRKIPDLENMLVGCQAGTTGETFLRENLKSAKAKPFRDGYEACLALKNDEIDAVILDEFPALALTKANKDLKIIDLNLPSEEYAVAVKKGNTELLQMINRAIRILRLDGAIKNLEFCGGHAELGDGYSSAYSSGDATAKKVIAELSEEADDE